MSKLFRLAAVVAALFVAAGLTTAQDKKDEKKPVTVAGKVKSVDAKESKIVLEGKKQKDVVGPDQTFSVAKDAKVTINGESKKLDDVKSGAQATLTLNDKKDVTAITIGKKKDK